MVDLDKSDVPMLSKNDPPFSPFERNVIRTRSASMSMFMNSKDSYENETNFNVSHTGPLRSQRSSFIPMSGPLYVNNNLHHSLQGQSVTGKNEAIEKNSSIKEVNQDEWADDFSSKNQHLLRSGQLGICNDPYCTTCPTYYHFKGAPHKHSKASAIFDRQLHNALYGDAKGWVARFFSFIGSYIPGVMNPHAKVVQQWNQFFVISCLVAIFVDPLFFFLLSVQENYKCIVLNSPMTTTIVVLRSLTDFIYSLHILLQFRLAYVAPETMVVGAGDLVDHPKKVAINYLRGYFLIDFFVVLPLPQIIILLILPVTLGSGANYAKNLLRAAVLVQYIPRLYRFLPMLAGQSPSGFIFESAWANFIINLLTFVLAGHVVGSCWYLFGLQRVNQCLRNACHNSKLNMCMEFIDCGHGNKIHEFMQHPNWSSWTKNVNATACFSENGFSYGIYVPAVNLTTRQSIITRYVYSLFWGFQQISTLAGNQIPSYFVWEVLFTMAIIGLGLLLFALLIGNMQNFLQGLEKRRLEMSLRRRDVEQWMSHRRLPKELRRQVRQAERYNWAATRGVNEEMLLENLPEDLQRDIRRHLFKFIKKVRIFSLMDDPILDAICERLRQKTYIKGSKIFCTGGLMDKMVFVVRGKLESTGVDGIKVPLKEGDACGEELLTWYLEHSSIYKNGKRIRIPGLGLLSSRTVRCLTNVEAFSLRAVDLEEVTSLFSRFLRNPRVQGAIRYESHYWRGLAATHIQVAWRYRKKRLKSYCSNTHSS